MSGESMGGKGLFAFVLAAFAGAIAVYIAAGSLNKGSGHESAETRSPAEAGASKSADGPAAASGKLAAFVAKKTPEPVPAVTFKDGAGNDVTLEAFKGRTVLVNLWATWCGPCREEMPSLDRLQAALGSDKFEVIALSLDRGGADASKKFLDEVKATNLKLYVDPSAKAGSALKLIGMPTTVLINREGQEVGRLAGSAEWDSEEAKKLIEATLR